MQKFTTHTGKAAVLWRENVDTDQIIPKEHLKSIKRTGFGPALFSNWRYLDNGQPNPDFELNQSRYQGASILITGNNFGCGSSREHAVWAICQDGYVAIIAPIKGKQTDSVPGFADIFRNNSFKNGLLTIELSEQDAQALKKAVEDFPNENMTINLAEQTITFKNIVQKFDIDLPNKTRLLEGLDDIGTTLLHENDISKFEKNHNAQLG